MNKYLVLALSVGVLSSMYPMDYNQPISASNGGGQGISFPGGVLTMDVETAERFAQALHDPWVQQENEQLRAQVTILEGTIASQWRSIWRMRMIFIVAGIGFCYGIGKKAYESWNYRETNDVRSQAHDVLQKIIKPSKNSQLEPFVW